MQALEEIPQLTSDRIETFLNRQSVRDQTQKLYAEPLTRIARDALRGGKRLRAQFCAIGWAMTGPTEFPDAVIDMAASLEIFQTAALIHDDIIDNSDTRRGKAAAHRAFASFHRESGWISDPASFGVSAAIILGDLLVAWSDDLFEEAIASLSTAAATRKEYADMRRDVTVGQFLDIAQESAWVKQSPAEHATRAIEIASFKTARYSVQQPLILGATAAGGSAEQLAALRAFGHPLGLAFQMRDDLLGVFGDTQKTGKPSGDDLRQGKRTVLVAFTRDALEKGRCSWFDAQLGNPDLSENTIKELQQMILDSGAVQRVESFIHQLTSEAEAALNGASFHAQARTQLEKLATAAIHRSA